MAKLINPTRMELNKYKRRVKTAVRGHKLLKDKQDEMARQFMLHIRRNMELRRKVEEKLAKVMAESSVAAARMGSSAVREALLVPARSAKVSLTVKNIMSVNVPSLRYEGGDEETQLPYGFAFSSGELDGAVMTLADLLPDLIELAGVEKTCDMLAEEMEEAVDEVCGIESERSRAVAFHDKVVPFLDEVRVHVDALEMIVDDQMWPLPKYRELLFIR